MTSRQNVLHGYVTALKAALEPGQSLGFLSAPITSGRPLLDLAHSLGYTTIDEFMDTLEPSFADLEECGRNFEAYLTMTKHNLVEAVEHLAAVRHAHPDMLVITPTTLNNLNTETDYAWFWREIITEFTPVMFLCGEWNMSAGIRNEVRAALDAQCDFFVINDDLEINHFDNDVIKRALASSEAEFASAYADDKAPKPPKYITHNELCEKIEARLDSSYDLTYVDYSDQLNNEQLAKGVEEGVMAIYNDDSIMEWVCDQKYDSIGTIIKETFETVRDELTNDGYDLDEFDEGDFFGDLRDIISDRDTSTPEDDLINQTPDVLCRVALTNIDAENMAELSASEILTRLKLPVTDDNVKEMQEALNNSSAGYDGVYLEAQAVFMFEPSLLIAEDEDTKFVEVDSPRIWLTNPYQGDGWMTGPLSGTVRFDRTKLRVDAGHGWSAADVFGFTTLPDTSQVRFIK